MIGWAQGTWQRLPEMQTPGDSASVRGTASVLAARAALAALDEQGRDAQPALRAAGLSREALTSIDNRLPYENMRRLWEAAAEVADDPYFGLHVAEKEPPGANDLMDYVMSAATDVGTSFSRLAHYIRLLYDRSNLQLVLEPAHARLVRRVSVPARQYDEFALAVLLVRSRQFSGTHWVPELATFQHHAVDDQGELVRIFGCDVQFSAPDIELRFATPILALPHVRADSRLLAILTRYADSLLAAMPARGDVVGRASSSIARQMATELPTLPSTAAALRMHLRTLQRQLAAAGVSHSALLDQVRRGLALKYIGDAGLSVFEIAYVLHYSDGTTFVRAFKRWTGESPLRYRERLFRGVDHVHWQSRT